MQIQSVKFDPSFVPCFVLKMRGILAKKVRLSSAQPKDHVVHFFL